jgi:hypothetical protein
MKHWVVILSCVCYGSCLSPYGVEQLAEKNHKYQDVDQESHTNQNSSINHNNISRIDRMGHRFNESILVVRNSFYTLGAKIQEGFSYLKNKWNSWFTSLDDDNETQYSDHDIKYINKDIKPQQHKPRTLSIDDNNNKFYHTQRVKEVPSMIEGLDKILQQLSKKTIGDQDMMPKSERKNINKLVPNDGFQSSIMEPDLPSVIIKDDCIWGATGQQLPSETIIIADDQYGTMKKQGTLVKKTNNNKLYAIDKQLKIIIDDDGNNIMEDQDDVYGDDNPYWISNHGKPSNSLERKKKKHPLIEEESYENRGYISEERKSVFETSPSNFEEEKSNPFAVAQPSSTSDYRFPSRDGLVIDEPMANQNKYFNGDPYVVVKAPINWNDPTESSYEKDSSGTYQENSNNDVINNYSGNQTQGPKENYQNNLTKNSKTSKESSQHSFLKIEQSKF